MAKVMPASQPHLGPRAPPAQVDSKDCTGATALHRAASTGRTDVIRALLAAGARINARNADKATPLLLAAIAGHQPAAILLAGKGADVEVRPPARLQPGGGRRQPALPQWARPPQPFST